MGKTWDSTGIAYDVGLWREVLRVLKPGGHLLAFGGTRTHHRMVCAIEDAGFEIRDEIQWLYGSGFPKSLDVSKAIDKAAGAEREKKRHKPRPETCGTCDTRPWIEESREKGYHEVAGDTPVTLAAAQWDGWGTALKPACEPICVARKPLCGTVAANVLAHGTGAINVDGCRVEFQGDTDKDSAKPQGRATTKEHGAAAATPDAGRGIGRIEFPIKQHDQGRWPANVILSHAEGCVCTGTKRVKSGNHGTAPGGFNPTGGTLYGKGDATKDVSGGYAAADGLELVEAWQCVEGCPVRLLDAQSGELTSGQPMNRMHTDPGRAVASGASKGGVYLHQGFGDTGGASRFFYTAKASRSEREHFNNHATVKPLALMRYLVRLVTPPGGTVLDWCAGSGTTLVAARQEGFKFIGCELDEAHADIIRRRLELELPFA
jgi:site-specific DNA-methyltransferase (adenine-specific)